MVRIIESGPTPAIHGVVRWRLRDLAWWVFEEFRISLDETTVSREVRKLGFRKLPAPLRLPLHHATHGGASGSLRPQHYAQNEAAMADFKKPSRPNWRRLKQSSRPVPL